LNILVELVGDVLVQNNGVLGLVLDCSNGQILYIVKDTRLHALALGPLLLLLLCAGVSWCYLES
jgi:hypothetical protein